MAINLYRIANRIADEFKWKSHLYGEEDRDLAQELEELKKHPEIAFSNFVSLLSRREDLAHLALDPYLDEIGLKMDDIDNETVTISGKGLNKEKIPFEKSDKVNEWIDELKERL
jgi:hypothetical protein